MKACSGKLLVIVCILLLLALVSSWTVLPPPDPPPAEPSIQELATARKLYEISGDNGWAHIYLERWPQYAAYIRGEVTSIEDIEQGGDANGSYMDAGGA